MIKRKAPLMGWASWNCFKTNINEEKLKAQADALIELGLAECGYTYLNIDDGFFGGRHESGQLLFHKERFPNGIKPVADYAHSKGLKAGIYSDGGDSTCAFYHDGEGESGRNVGLYGYEEQDLKMYLEEFGFDFIKLDWCGGIFLGLDDKEQYTKIGNIINEISERIQKPIIFNVCRWQFPGKWVTEVADSWRISADIKPNFASILKQIDATKPLARYCSPGHVNDLDMLQLGNGLNHQEEKTHFAMWCMMSTPLVIGCDLTKIKAETLEILKNKELIAINQDTACLQAVQIKDIFNDNVKQGEVWVKNLGSAKSSLKAVAVLNRSSEALSTELDFLELGFCGEILEVRDLSNHVDIEPVAKMKLNLKPQETVVFKIECSESFEVINPFDEGDIEPKPIEKITYDTAKQLMSQGAILVDVRSKEEFDKSHLDGAINIPFYYLHGFALDMIKDKNTRVIVYCSRGKRSIQSYNDLGYLGYKNIYYLGAMESML
ncbi:MAG: glycoside hydrolase family 27 protein [Ruminococcaceae bacterium]|nr:glycoside hydrolase family 27 protein [Oscillospiraceae bacterium]